MDIYSKIPETFKRSEDLIKAIEEFLQKENFLLSEDLNERAMTHKLAEYIQKYFQDYNVDCEYNRMRDKDGKEYNTKKLNIKSKNINLTNIKQTTVYPDIIIHKRGNNNDNLLAIETKKKVNLDEEDKKYDFKKLKAMTLQLEYLYGAYIEFDESNISDIKFFKDGKEC